MYVCVATGRRLITFIFDVRRHVAKPAFQEYLKSSWQRRSHVDHRCRPPASLKYRIQQVASLHESLLMTLASIELIRMNSS